MTNKKDEPGPKRLFRLKEKIKEIKLKEIKQLSLNLIGEIKKQTKYLWLLAKSDKKTIGNVSILILITLSPWISEISINKQVYAEIAKYSNPLDPVKAGEMSEAIGQFTPVLDEKKEDIALSVMSQSNTYSLSQQLSLNDGKKLDEPDRQDATYTVEKGETITEIAQKFDLHVASILEANKIDPLALKNIREGTVLSIPSSDTSTSQDWLIAVNRAEEEERQRQVEEANKRRQLELARSSSRALAASTTTRTASANYSNVDTGSLMVPINHNGISRGYGGGHYGIDYMAGIGTPIYSSASGTVVVTSYGWSGGYGNQIVVDHGGGRATRYAHLSSISVSPGQSVSKGQVIGYSGNTGRSTGPHLHFEVIVGGRPVPWR